jgi:hypothetical protein
MCGEVDGAVSGVGGGGEREEMISYSTLLVIGNGFDLQCGLKSSYTNFFEWLRQDTSRANNNLWAVHFLNTTLKGELWIDVEDGILRALSTGDKGVIPIDYWIKEADNYFKSPNHLRPYYSTTIKESRYIVEHTIAKNVSQEFGSCFSYYWFLDELRAFECQFSAYLKCEVANNANYLPNVDKLMKMMTDGKKVNVISFNYTNPFKFDYSKADEIKISDMVSTVSNVHGTYEDENIIFGVDTTSKLPQDAHIFTKTHRKMLQRNSDRASFGEIKTIKFYGHSLGQSDYSYFQSIFDSCNIYRDVHETEIDVVAPVTLQFYFTIYDASKKTEIVRDATDKVYKLITAYGDTLDNKDKGKNLLHKLLLEGRVQIKFFPTL